MALVMAHQNGAHKRACIFHAASHLLRNGVARNMRKNIES